jgi:hypothetical protein
LVFQIPNGGCCPTAGKKLHAKFYIISDFYSNIVKNGFLKSEQFGRKMARIVETQRCINYFSWFYKWFLPHNNYFV